MLKRSANYVIAGVSTLCGLYVFLVSGSAQAQTPKLLSSPQAPLTTDQIVPLSEQPASHLLPLEPQTMAIETPFDGLEAIAHSINTQMMTERNAPTEGEGIDLESIPLVGEFVDEDGNFDMGLDLPVNINIADVMGETGVVLGITF